MQNIGWDRYGKKSDDSGKNRGEERQLGGTYVDISCHIGNVIEMEIKR